MNLYDLDSTDKSHPGTWGLIGFKYCRWHNKACLGLKCIEVIGT